MVTKRRSAAEIIATHLCYDFAEMSEYRYQSTRYTVAVYAIGEFYYCAPSSGKKPPQDRKWEVVGTYYDRPVYRSISNKLDDNQ